MQQYVTIGNPTLLRGYYVYEWRDCNIPFYVGMGAGRRAWKPHLYLPEKRRRESTVFRVHIVKQGLTKKQAHLHERYHIIELTRRGLTLCNTRIPNVSRISSSR